MKSTNKTLTKYRTPPRELEFKIATKPSELKMVYRLVWEIYGKELNYFQPTEYKDKKYKDKYDRYSVNFLAFNHNKPVGALRLILNSPYGFYIEKDFPIIKPRIQKTFLAELSRFAVLKKYRGKTKDVSIGLIKTALAFSKSKHITHWYALTGYKLKESFEKYGLHIKFRPIPYGKLTPQQIKERKRLESYYNVVKPLPYLISLGEVEKIIL